VNPATFIWYPFLKYRNTRNPNYFEVLTSVAAAVDDEIWFEFVNIGTYRYNDDLGFGGNKEIDCTEVI